MPSIARRLTGLYSLASEVVRGLALAPLASRQEGVAASELGRLRLKIDFYVRRPLVRNASRVPFAQGVSRWAVSRAETWRGLRLFRGEAGMPEDAVRPSDVASTAAADRDREQVLAEIDQDGFAFAADARDTSFFNRRTRRLPRRRYRIDVVFREGRVCLRKEFVRPSATMGLKNWLYGLLGLAFYSEVAALLRLQGVPGAPRLRAVDPRRRAVYMDFLIGQTLRDRLAMLSEPVHDLDLACHPDLSNLSEDRRDERERLLFRPLCNEALKESLSILVAGFNRRGVALRDIKYGNVIVGARTHALYWLDFERAHLSSYLGWAEAVDEQNRLLNIWFDLGWATSVELKESGKGNVYSPVDFEPLPAVGDVTDVEVGEGRWRWLLRDLTDWRRKRILDLGSNNCLYAFRALASGAAEVTCVERDLGFYQQAQFVRRVVEQAEGPLNARLVNADILTFLRSLAVPDRYFDITMALCSLYYLNREEIAEAMQIVARVSKECWLQSDIGTERESDDLREKASPGFLAEQLRSAGFGAITEIAPRRYSRPLLLGRREPESR